ncbi:MAG: ATP-binding cassette domain-containing protein, partial [Bacteroidota bacterium]
MNIFKAFQSSSRFFYAALLFLGMVNSVLFSAILIFINYTLSGTPLPFFPEYDWLIFLGLLVVSMTVSKVFQTYMIKLTNKITFDYEIKIFQKLRFATYQAFEKLGAQRVYTVISDTRTLSQVPESFINVINAGIVIICGLGYLFWVAPIGASGVLAVMVILLVVYMLRNRKIEKQLNHLRDLQDNFHEYIRDLLLGFKEVKMSINRNDNIYHKFIKQNRLKSKDINTGTSIKYLDNELTGSYSWYIVLGVILFAMPAYLDMKIEQVSAFVVTVLYLMGPVAVLITTLPFYTRVKIALERITQMEKEVEESVSGEKTFSFEAVPEEEFERLQFKDVCFEYYDEKQNNTFNLGPINLDIRKGEILFLTGGNGSGKSTFVNVLTGLYKPTKGEIIINGKTVSPEQYPYYSDRISAIFTDNYLFSDNYDGFELKKSNNLL